MNLFDNEDKIIEHFQGVEKSSVLMIGQNKGAISIFNVIHNEHKWKHWKNSSGKSDPPPDFFSDKYELMMEVMRVDDHAHINKKGGIVNPVNARESKIQKNLRDLGILDNFPNIESIFVNAVTDLPTDEDHNYVFYRDNFIRAIESHKNKINLYKKNHPGYRLIFFVFDESSAYVESKGEKLGKIIPAARPHFPFLDRAFVDTILNSEIDYLIWYMPFKLLQTEEGHLDLPQVCVIDVRKYESEIKNMGGEVITYNTKLMVSSEE